jgi:hypothetical protein
MCSSVCCTPGGGITEARHPAVELMPTPLGLEVGGALAIG